jgi:hypothetical protein
VGIGIGVSFGTGDWAYFETERLESLADFEGESIRFPNLQLGHLSVVSRIVLPVDIKPDGLWSRLNGDSVDISGTAESEGLGISEGIGLLRLVEVEDGPPAPTLNEIVREVEERVYADRATSHEIPPDTAADSTDQVPEPDEGGAIGDGDGVPDSTPAPDEVTGENQFTPAPQDAGAMAKDLAPATLLPPGDDEDQLAPDDQVSYPGDGDDAAATDNQVSYPGDGDDAAATDNQVSYPGDGDDAAATDNQVSYASDGADDGEAMSEEP